MPSLLNLLRSRKVKLAAPRTVATGAAAASCHFAPGPGDNRTLNPMSSVASNEKTSRSTSPSTATSESASYCLTAAPDEADEILHSSDISVSIEVKESEPRAIKFFRRIAASLMRVPISRSHSPCKADKAAPREKSGESSDKRRRQRWRSPQPQEAEVLNVTKPMMAARARRRRLPIRLRDVLCWPYAAADEPEDAYPPEATARGDSRHRGGRAQTPSEIECMYSVRQLQAIGTQGSCQRLPMAADADEQEKKEAAKMQACGSSAEASAEMRTSDDIWHPPSGAAGGLDAAEESNNCPVEPAERLLASAEQLDAFLEPRRRRLRLWRLPEEKAREAPEEMKIGRQLRLFSTEQRRQSPSSARSRNVNSCGSILCEHDQQKQHPDASADDTHHRLSDWISSDSLDVAPATSIASSAASTDEDDDASSFSPQQAFAKLSLVTNTCTTDELLVTGASASSDRCAVNTRCRAASTGSIEAPDDCATG